MKSLRIFDGHLRYAVLAVTLVFAAVVPAFASAEQLTSRSVALSSSSKAATGVNYTIGFTADSAAGAAVVQFCSNSPLIGEFCDTPAGFTAAGATAGTGTTSVDDASASTVKITKTITAGAMSFEIGGITNPSAAGTIYARILTYTDAAAAATYSVDDSTTSTLGSPIDQGSAALAITDTVGVSAAVRESLIFCVSGEGAGATNPITASCGGTLVAPVLTLGNEVETDVFALDSSSVYTGDIYTQISTNAIGGAVVSLKSSTTGCGGLALNGTGACNIPAAGAAGNVVAATAGFGVKTGATNTDTDGTIQAVGSYDNTNYRLNWVTGDASGVTGPYGDPILDTDGDPASNKDMKLTFGATASNNTPAGKYSADISLIATGTF